MRIKEKLRMFFSLLVILLSNIFLFSAVSAQQSANPLILQGNDAGFDEYDFVVSITIQDTESNQFFTCSGSFIHPQYIATAAHCVQISNETRLSASEFTVRFGNQELNRIRNLNIASVSEVTVHPDYDSNTLFNDIAVLKLTEPAAIAVEDSEAGITPVKLALLDNVSQVESGARLVVAGWGLTDAQDDNSFPDKLQVGNINLISGEVCDNNYFGYRIERNLCANNLVPSESSVCGGDSGGPLFIEREGVPYLMGVTSAGPQVCGQGFQPDVFTSVCAHLKFLDAAMGDDFTYTDQQCPTYPNPQVVLDLNPDDVIINDDSLPSVNFDEQKKTANGSVSWPLILVLLGLGIIRYRQTDKALIK